MLKLLDCAHFDNYAEDHQLCARTQLHNTAIPTLLAATVMNIGLKFM